MDKSQKPLRIKINKDINPPLLVPVLVIALQDIEDLENKNDLLILNLNKLIRILISLMNDKSMRFFEDMLRVQNIYIMLFEYDGVESILNILKVLYNHNLWNCVSEDIQTILQQEKIDIEQIIMCPICLKAYRNSILVCEECNWDLAKYDFFSIDEVTQGISSKISWAKLMWKHNQFLGSKIYELESEFNKQLNTLGYWIKHSLDPEYESSHHRWYDTNKLNQELISPNMKDLDIEFIEKIPCKLLASINEAWIENSEGYYGFTVQQEIWENSNENWEEFLNQVQWVNQDNNPSSSKSFTKLCFNKGWNKGHFPLPNWIVKDTLDSSWKYKITRASQEFTALMRRLKQCNIQ